MSKNYLVSISCEQYECSTPQEGARAVLAWIRDDNPGVFYFDLEDMDSGEQVHVKVEG